MKTFLLSVMSIALLLAIVLIVLTTGPHESVAGQSAGLSVTIIPQPDRPLEIQGASCALSEGDRLKCPVRLLNRSQKDVTSLGVKWIIKRADGQTTSNIHLEDPSFPPGRGSFKANQLIVMGDDPHDPGIGIGPGSVISKIGVKLEFVEFSDGSVWGNLDSPALAELRANRVGAQFAYGNLRHIYKTKGLEALLKELGVE